LEGLIETYQKRIETEIKKDELQSELDAFNRSALELQKIIEKRHGWVVFGYTNAFHKLLSFKFREPNSKNFAQFKILNRGVFNPLPFNTGENKSLPYVLLAEGEFNILSLQSLLLNNNLSPAMALALGSSSGVDWYSLKGFKEKWLLFKDNDEAGSKLAENMKEHRTFLLVGSPLPGEDLDGFIHRHHNPNEALTSLQKLLSEVQQQFRYTASIIEEINDTREGTKRPSFAINQSVSELLGEELLERGAFYKSVLSPYFLDYASQSLYPIHKGQKKTQRFLHSFSLNPCENIHNFVLHELERIAFEKGLETTIYYFAHYDKASNQLYLFNKDTEVFRVSTKNIEVVPNGTDGILFDTLPGYIPFNRVETSLETDLLAELYSSRINIQEGVLSFTDYQMLVEGWVYHLFFDELHATHPILSFIGPKGSSKTSSIRRLGMLLFGSSFQVSAMPEKPDDFDAITTNAFLAAFDNVDGSSAWMNDKLAIAATGGMIRKRELYSTNNLIEFPIKSHLAITSRTPKFRRDDVAERLLLFPLKTLDKKVSEQYLSEEIKQNRDQFMSWLLLRLQEILNDLEKTQDVPEIQTNLRMADFATFMLRLAMAEGAENAILSLLERLASIQSQFTLEQDPLFELLEMVATQQPGKSYKTSELHTHLKDLAVVKGIKYQYGSPNSLGQRISHIKNNLDEFMDVTITPGSNNSKYYQFAMKEVVDS
ncbi:MAG: hypothetical protein K2X66_18470, partial [Cyanobacteria bacterium]|nr:hypothetical protein [Cyanobacteriota bacterium]